MTDYSESCTTTKDIVDIYRQLYRPLGHVVDWDRWIKDYEKREKTQEPIKRQDQLSGIECREILDGLAEPSYQEVSTTAFISDYLLSLGFTLKPREGKILQNETELVFSSSKDKPKIYFRVDLDAVSIGEGKHKHFCGHSINMSSILQVAKKIKEDKLNVGLIFQPAEEGPGNNIDGYVHPEGCGGGQYLRKKGIYKGIDTLISCHIDTSLQDNEVRISPGCATAAAYRFIYKVIGKPAHAALPWQGENPIEKITDFLTNLRTLFKELPKEEYGLVTPSKIFTAECELNSLSPWAEVRGISRNSGLTSLKLFEDFMNKYGAEIELEAPPVMNDSELAKVATNVAKEKGFNCIVAPARFRDETAWAGPFTKPWVKHPEKYESGCSRILHFFTPACNPDSGGLHSMTFMPNYQEAIEAQVKLLHRIAVKLAG